MKKINLFIALLITTVFTGCEFSLEETIYDLTKPSTYTVKYDTNGADNGLPPSDSNEYKAGDEVTVLDNAGNLAKNGVFFSGWNTQPDGSGTTYSGGDKFIISDNDVILYARWSNNPVFRISFDANGAEGGGSPSCYRIL